MSSATPVDIQILVKKIREQSDIIHSGWLARPAVDHPCRHEWEERCREQLMLLKGLVRQAKRPTPVPPLVLAYIVEHNNAVTTKRPYNYEDFNPNNALEKAGHFVRDTKYRFSVQAAGWWQNLGAFAFLI